MTVTAAAGRAAAAASVAGSVQVRILPPGGTIQAEPAPPGALPLAASAAARPRGHRDLDGPVTVTVTIMLVTH